MRLENFSGWSSFDQKIFGSGLPSALQNKTTLVPVFSRLSSGDVVIVGTVRIDINKQRIIMTVIEKVQFILIKERREFNFILYDVFVATG